MLGLIENMSWLSCPRAGEKIEIFRKGDGEATAKSWRDFLGAIPQDPKVGNLAEQVLVFVGRETSPGGIRFHCLESPGKALASFAVTEN